MSASRAAMKAFMALGLAQVACAQVHRDPQSGELVKFVNTLSTTGVAGHTQYEVGMTINGNVRNIYTLASDVSQGHVSSIPAAYQVPAPFGANSGGVNPAYFPYEATCQFDSWLTVGKVDGSGGLGGIGIDYAGWTETAPLTIDNGAIFWMDPNAATPARTLASSPGTDVVLAHLTIRTGTTWSMTIGEIQGRSLNGMPDFAEVDMHFSNVAATDCRTPSDAAGPYSAYILQENDLALSSFSVTATCASGYSGHAVVTPCPAGDEEYGISGCVYRVECTAPPTAQGGDYAVTETSLAFGGSFDVTYTCCSAGTGMVPQRAGMCRAPNSPYLLSGCSGGYHGCGGASAGPSPPTPGSMETFYVINPTSNQCGESSIPITWEDQATQWATTSGYSVRAGTCASVGYTVSAGQTTIPRTGAPDDPVVMLYTQATSCVDDSSGALSTFGYTCAQALTAAGGAGCASTLDAFGSSQTLSVACPQTCDSCGGTGPGGH
jgi:hypothetical protein